MKLMNRIQWETDIVEKPFCRQLQAMGWQWIEGDTDVAEFTERQNFREVLHLARKAGFWKLRQYYPCLGILPTERR